MNIGRWIHAENNSNMFKIVLEFLEPTSSDRDFDGQTDAAVCEDQFLNLWVHIVLNG